MKHIALALTLLAGLSACSYYDESRSERRAQHDQRYTENQRHYSQQMRLPPMAAPRGATSDYFGSEPFPERGPDNVMYDPRWDNFRRGRNQRN
jgi:uncharacterized lipoprotein